VPQFGQVHARTFSGNVIRFEPATAAGLGWGCPLVGRDEVLAGLFALVFLHGGKLVAVYLVLVRLDCQRLAENEPHRAELAVE
jgi:hypothetical protein